jgi:hypothetical protein
MDVLFGSAAAVADWAAAANIRKVWAHTRIRFSF